MRIRRLVVMVALLAVVCMSPMAIAATADAAKEAAVAEINAALRELRDVTCTMTEERDPPAPADEAAPPATLHVKPPDRVRITSVDPHGNQRLTIKNGNTEWRVIVPRSVSKTVWPDDGVPPDSPVPILGPDAYRMMRSGVMSSKGRALRRVVHAGIEDVEGVPCHRFETHRGRTLTWIAVADGLIRRQERHGDEGVHVTRFTDFTINHGLDDALFEYEPEEGARVSVNEHVDGEWRRFAYRVPHTPVDPEQQVEARAKLAELQERFGRATRFSFQLFETYTAHAVHAMTPDGRRLPVGHERTGRLTVQPPDRIRFEGERRDLSAPLRRRLLLLISDGTSVWTDDRDANAPDEQPRVVMKDRLLPAGAWKDRARAEAVLRGAPHEGTDITFRLPSWLLAPLGGIETDRIRFAGEALIDGARTWRFDVKATDDDAASAHWIGVADGIPRRIEVRNAFGNVVETTVRITDVRVDPWVSPGTFTFEDDGTATVVEMQDMRRWHPDDALPTVDG